MALKTEDFRKIDFLQKAPSLENQYLTDPLLDRYLAAKLPKPIYESRRNHLSEVGAATTNKLLAWADQAERQEPILKSHTPWGERTDEIELSASWKNLEDYAVTNGMIACAYERKEEEFSRVYQAALLYLFHPSSAFVTCPMAMTDGAARALELYGSPEQKNKYFPRLTSRDPRTAWSSGQWMTEKTGGSDVGQSRTLARQEGPHWKLSGLKWFTSATTSQMAMTLARSTGAEEGVKGLSLFLIESRDPAGALQNIQILRLKNKLGTKALATAELLLDGTPAELVGGLGGGVRKIASLFNISRIYNAICALGDLRRGLALADSYSQRRQVFGKKLEEQPMHQRLMLELETDFAKCFHFTFYVAGLLGLEETGKASEDQKSLLRILTPLLKIYTGKKVVSVISEVIEIFAGQGYVEDTGLPRLIRNAQVFPIWEGTTNVLSLDLLRAFSKEAPFEIFEKFFADLNPSELLKDRLAKIKTSLLAIPQEELHSKNRLLAWNLADIFCCVLLENFAHKTNSAQDSRWSNFANSQLKYLPLD